METSEKKMKDTATDVAAKTANYGVVLEPIVTEKSHQLMAFNKYVFKVMKDATKQSVEKAIHEVFQVTVKNVRIVNIHSKKRQYGRTVGRKQGFKKAIVTLKAGDKIDLFEGV